MVGWHHRLNAHEFEQTPGHSEGQGSLAAIHGVTKSWTQLGRLNKNVQRGFAGASVVKRNHVPMQETQVRSLGREDPLEEEVATHSSILAWKIPMTEEPIRLQSMGLKELDRT